MNSPSFFDNHQHFTNLVSSSSLNVLLLFFLDYMLNQTQDIVSFYSKII